MGLPSKRRSKSQRKRRASHFALKHQGLTKCPQCKRDRLPHRACPFCGYYKGRKVITTRSSKTSTRKKS